MKGEESKAYPEGRRGYPFSINGKEGRDGGREGCNSLGEAFYLNMLKQLHWLSEVSKREQMVPSEDVRGGDGVSPRDASIQGMFRGCSLEGNH